MVYFITTSNKFSSNLLLEADLAGVKLTILDSLDVLLDWLTVSKRIYFDKEFSDLNVRYALPILTQIGDEEHQFIVDDRDFPKLDYLEAYKEKEFVGHNIKIDISLARLQGVDIRNVYDTMITEQRLGLGSGRRNDLETTYNRRCKKELPQDKKTSEDFIKMDKNSILEFRHIYYSAKDVEVLPYIVKEQEEYIKKFKYERLLFDIEFPLIPILADGELEGFNIDIEGWKNLIADNKKSLFEKERALDEELRKIGFKGKAFRLERKKATYTQTSLFGEDREYENLNKGKINYSSSKQVLKLFKDLELEIPNLVVKNASKDSVQIEALQAYNLNYPNNVFFNFLEVLIEYKEIQKEINSFGEKFYKSLIFKKTVKKPFRGYLNPDTQKIHTIYRQCMTKTGRLASGEADLGLYNSQQIPALKKYRNLFTLSQQEIDDDWWIVTADLTGAETVIMCAFAKDPQLYKWAVEEDDLHSPLATLCWRAVYQYRKDKQDLAWINGGQIGKDVFKIKSVSNNKKTGVPDVAYLTEDFVVDKNNNTTFRTDFKTGGTFAVIYGAGASTVAKAFNISVEEAKVIIKTIKKAIPDTFRMVEQASAFALENAYVIHNSRTNSRKWFMPAFNKFIPDNEKFSIESEARNCRIQGTQADGLKEAMVNIAKYFKENDISNCFLLQVHDELVWKVKGKENAKHVGRIMAETLTLYLDGFVEMKTDADILHTWNK